MDALGEQIAMRLERTFARRGFAEPGVAELREAAEVSLRTLYKRFPSREEMVIGALDARHGRYLAHLEIDAPPPGPDAVAHFFDRLGLWMREEASEGCLFVAALAAHPGNQAIRGAVDRHKSELRSVLARRSGRPERADALFLLHEGATFSWRLLGAEAVSAARDAALRLLEEDPR